MTASARPLALVWTVAAAFLTYFCMYGFRKPFTAATFAEPMIGSLGFKELLVIAQTMGYMLSKFIGIKIISEMPPHRRAISILVLVALSELALVFFAITPRPWSAVWLFLNGLPLGMVFGLVIGFLEGRRTTEALAAGLCTSFILADGVTKSVGSWLLTQGIPEQWMPAAAGGLFTIPLLIGVAMLKRVPAPTDHDVESRSERSTMSSTDRRRLLMRYWPGLAAIVFAYIIVTVLRSYRADFGPQLWEGLLGVKAAPEAFTVSEFWVALGILLVSGATVFIRSNVSAFFTSLLISLIGLVVLAGSLFAWNRELLSPLGVMVGIGLGLYLPYVAIHTTVFERFLAATREKGNLGFLMSVADSFGYLGYVGVMLLRAFFNPGEQILPYFIGMCWLTIVVGLTCLTFAIGFFTLRFRRRASA